MLTTYTSREASCTHAWAGKDEAAWLAFSAAPGAYDCVGGTRPARRSIETELDLVVVTGSETGRPVPNGPEEEWGGCGMQVTGRAPLVSYL
jgi:hypothetical protein